MAILDITIDPASRVPVYAQLMQMIKLQIAKRMLPPHSQLPTVRDLALHLLINPNTVQKTYSQLIEDGVLYSRRGVGVFVSEMDPSLTEQEEQRQAQILIDNFITDCMHLGLSEADIQNLLRKSLSSFKKKRES